MRLIILHEYNINFLGPEMIIHYLSCMIQFILYGTFIASNIAYSTVFIIDNKQSCNIIISLLDIAYLLHICYQLNVIKVKSVSSINDRFIFQTFWLFHDLFHFNQGS